MAFKFFQKISLQNGLTKSTEKVEIGDGILVLIKHKDNTCEEKILKVTNQENVFTSTAWTGYKVKTDSTSVFATGKTELILNDGSVKTVDQLSANKDHCYGNQKVTSIETGKILCGKKCLEFVEEENWDKLFVKINGTWISATKKNDSIPIKNEDSIYIFPKNPLMRFLRKQMIKLNEK